MFCALAVTVERPVDQLFYAVVWKVGVVHLVVLACVPRATTTKKGCQLFRAPCRDNPGYAREFAHPWKNSADAQDAAMMSGCTQQQNAISVL